jgi:hypothetical protein
MGYEPKDSLSRKRIQEEFPWVIEPDRNMIIGSDIDAIISASFLHEHLNWEPVGFYTDFENLYTKSSISTKDATDAVWVDLDIYHPDIPSIGHHILNFRLSDDIPGHTESLNPNLLRGMYHGNFRQKYPLGTIHFLSWLHRLPKAATKIQKLLYWLPDSTWINGQSHRFRENVRDWLFNCIPCKCLIETFDWIEESEFEESLQGEIYSRIEEAGFSRGRGQVTSKHLNLGGYQCSFINPNNMYQRLQALADLIAEIMNWEPLSIPTNMNALSGSRTSNYSYSKVIEEYDGIDEFLSAKDVFSYAIPNRNTLNYTTDLNIGSI